MGGRRLLLDESGRSSANLAITRFAGAFADPSLGEGSSSSEELLPEHLRLSEDTGLDAVAPSPVVLMGGGNRPAVPCATGPAETGLGSLFEFTFSWVLRVAAELEWPVPNLTAANILVMGRGLNWCGRWGKWWSRGFELPECDMSVDAPIVLVGGGRNAPPSVDRFLGGSVLGEDSISRDGVSDS